VSLDDFDRYPLLFFHFYGVKRRGRHYFNSHRVYHAPFTEVMRRRIYEPYTAALCQSDELVAPYLAGERIKTIGRSSVGSPHDRVVNVLRSMRGTLNRSLDMITGRTIIVPKSVTR